jgi:hypothetical protein
MAEEASQVEPTQDEPTQEQEDQAILEVSGANEHFAMGSTIEIAGVHFEVRAPTNPEIALYGEASRRHDLEGAMAIAGPELVGGRHSPEEKALQRRYALISTDKAYLEAKDKKLKKDGKELERLTQEIAEIEEALVRASAKTRREQFAWTRLDTLAKQIDELEKEVLAEKATPAEMTTLEDAYDEHEKLQTEISQIQVKGQIKSLRTISKLYEAADATYAEVLWNIAKADHGYEDSLEDFAMDAKAEKVEVEGLINAMGFEHPLSVASRVARGKTGTGGTSRRERRAARKKTG